MERDSIMKDIRIVFAYHEIHVCDGKELYKSGHCNTGSQRSPKNKIILVPPVWIPALYPNAEDLRSMEDCQNMERLVGVMRTAPSIVRLC